MRPGGVQRRAARPAGGAFTGMLEYKARKHGRTFARIGRFEPTSQTCSACGRRHDRDRRFPVTLPRWTKSTSGEFSARRGVYTSSVTPSCRDVSPRGITERGLVVGGGVVCRRGPEPGQGELAQLYAVHRIVTLRLVVRETGICQAPRVLGRLDLKGLTRNDCGWQPRSLTSTPMSSVVSVEYAEVSTRQERTHDQERLGLHRLSTPDSCGVTIAGSALHGRDLGIRLWFMAPSRPVCPGRLPKGADRGRRLRAVRTGLGRPGVQSGRCRGRGQIRSALGCQRL